MHFAEDRVTDPLFIREYREGLLKTNAAEFSEPIVLFKDQALTSILPASFAELTAAHFQALADFDPELILLGSGSQHEFPAPQLLEPLYKKRTGFEVMKTDAACRTFNLLLAEGRSVLAALFV